MKKILVLALALALIFAIVGSVSAQKVEVTIWGLATTTPGGAQEQWKEFNRTHPEIKLVSEAELAAAGQIAAEMMKLTTAIAAGQPPDVANIDRFTIGGWAARGGLIALDPYIERDNFDLSKMYPSLLAEAQWKGKTYALSRSTDVRQLMYNRKHFREAGLDPESPPRTWSEYLDYVQKCTVREADGTLVHAGFDYEYREHLYFFIWQNGGDMMSPDRSECTLNDPINVEALKHFVSLYDIQGGAKDVKGFLAVFGTGAQHPFILEKYSMGIMGVWMNGTFAQYAPDLDYATAYYPVPDDRLYMRGRFKDVKPHDIFITWAGGWSWAIPKGAKHPDEAWEVIKWIVSPEGYAAYNRGQHEYYKSQDRLFFPDYTSWPYIDKIEVAKYWDEIYEYSPNIATQWAKMNALWDDIAIYVRPVTPVASELFEATHRATEKAIYHETTPEEALEEATKAVNTALAELEL